MVDAIRQEFDGPDPEQRAKAARERLRRELRTALLRSVLKLQRDVASKSFIGEYTPGAHPAEGLFTRSGQLARSIEGRVVEEGDTIVGFLTSSQRYARIQEFGTVGAGGTLPDVVPRQKRALTVPLPAALDPSGIVIETAGELLRKGETYLSKSKGGPPVVRRKSDDEGLFVLVQRVAIPPRLGARERARSAEFRRFRDRALRAAVRRASGAPEVGA